MSINSVMQNLRESASERQRLNAEEIQDIALELHINSPRGGQNINAFGQPRSAPGEAPAEEFGVLRNILRDPVQPLGSLRDNPGWRVALNYAQLEYGTNDGRIQPRPLLRMSLDEFKRRRGL